MHTLKDKVSLITGGANGIGAKVVKKFLEGGVKHIAILDINEEAGLALEKESNSKYGEGKIKFFKGDVTNDEELFAAYDKTMETFGVIDVVVNSAGIVCDSPGVYKKEININFTATVTSTLKALQLMRVDEGGKGGTIINISSIVGLALYSPNIFIYAATKCAVLHFTSCVGMEEYYRDTKVRVLTVAFGVTDTGIIVDMQCIDKKTTETIKTNIDSFRKEGKVQSGEAAAKGLVTAYENGKTGSTWLIDNSKTCDISKNVKDGFNIISANTSVEFDV